MSVKRGSTVNHKNKLKLWTFVAHIVIVLSISERIWSRFADSASCRPYPSVLKPNNELKIGGVPASRPLR